ncbi:MAG: glycosyltransferase [Bacteroidetes bacterium]|nr:MAG: glycosyltransferase [Bacteroidota bacterium]
MKVSIITVCYNSAAYIQDCINSVLEQDYPHIEYLIVDGGSEDGTVDLIRSYEQGIARWVSEPDEGIYDAMNKGIGMARGEIVGMLNADDIYAHSGVISRVVEAFRQQQVDTVFGDLVYFPHGQPQKVTRFFPGRGFHPRKLRQGIMPPHPTFFVRRQLYEQYGLFDTSYRICADFDLMVRLFHTHGVSYHYLPETLVKMRTGGASTRGLKSTRIINREMLQACRKHGISTNLLRIYSKYTTKIFQLIQQPAGSSPKS